MGSYGRKRLSHRMWFDVELRCPCRDFLEKITIDPKMGLVSLDFFSRACDFFWRLVRPNVNMEPYGKRGVGCPTFGGAATFDDAAISVNGRPAKFNDWPQVLVTLLGDLYEKRNIDLVLERVRSWSIELLHLSAKGRWVQRPVIKFPPRTTSDRQKMQRHALSRAHPAAPVDILTFQDMFNKIRILVNGPRSGSGGWHFPKNKTMQILSSKGYQIHWLMVLT